MMYSGDEFYSDDVTSGTDDDEYQGSSCEDAPCCGHDSGDCHGNKYGSDASIKADHYTRMRFADEFGDGFIGEGYDD